MRRSRKLPKKVDLTDLAHVACGALASALANFNYLLSATLTLCYILYQLLDFVVERDEVCEDIMEFTIGFALASLAQLLLSKLL
ncbi:MAG: hypothetical protein QXZ58_08335 [Candidatus Nezhaarchaeales archaeon]